MRAVCLCALVMLFGACGGAEADRVVITFPGSALGAEAEVLRLQLARFMETHPEIEVVQRRTPDAAGQRHQLYVQWLNARAGDPDVLQLDVIWTPEFAAAGWILPLEPFGVHVDEFFPATIEANRWNGKLFALPWFVDVGMLYWRTDLLERAPTTFAELTDVASRSRAGETVPYGFVWQGARYEGLVTVFLEHLGGFGGHIMDAEGRIVVDAEPAVQALRYMHDAIYQEGIVPQSVLTWQEEQTRFAFQNGQAVLMRNWPYAHAVMQDTLQSAVANRFSVSPMPRASGGRHTAALGGSQLAINANTEYPEAAFAVIDFLTQPEQMLERARIVGQYPTRPDLYQDPRLETVLSVPPGEIRPIIEGAVPRPVTPVYTQLSEFLQIWLHRALTRQETPERALSAAAVEMRRLLEKVELTREGTR